MPAAVSDPVSAEQPGAAPEWKHPVFGPNDRYTPGVVPIKKEFLLPKPAGSRDALKPADDDAAERGTNPAATRPDAASESTENGKAGENGEATGEPVKKLKGAARKRARKEEAAAKWAAERDAKKAKAAGADEAGKKGGQNKNRNFAPLKDSKGLCHGFLSKGEAGCKFAGKGCKFSHDLVAYLQDKVRDVYLPPTPEAPTTKEDHSEPERHKFLDERYSLTPIALNGDDGDSTYVKDLGKGDSTTQTDPAHQSLDLTTTCPIFARKGFCTMGWKCRFLGSHVRIVGPSRLTAPDAPSGYAGSGLEMVSDAAQMAAWRSRAKVFTLPAGGDEDQEELNFGTSAGMKDMRVRKYPLPLTKAALTALDAESRELGQLDPHGTTAGKGPLRIAPADAEDELEELENSVRNSGTAERVAEAAATTSSLDVARIRPSEKRRLNWKGELYLAPLTTTGNLPFRRICSSFGSDIHCGEMGLAESFLHGNSSEWSLVRRWEGERIFGTQLCGGKPDLLVPVAEALKREVGDGLDFVDINCGCPIDLVYNKGAGSALLDHPTKLSKIVRGMNAVLGDTPLTIKLRTGTSSKQTTHKLFARLQTEWGVSAATLHGRSRKQRYKNDADWGYIRDCADTLRSNVRTWNEEARHADEEEMVPIPIYGNGDVFSWQDYYERKERTGVDGEMIARGALIKPWLFTEIKERRDWDISARERLDMIRQFAEYGVSHWGSDTHGVNTTRRFLCEMLSFTHRYVPTGLLEFLPTRLNDRPPLYKGRDALETLLASSNANDWVKISEMFLGKTPDEWSFTPKHKSSSYADPDGGTEQQG